MMIGFTKAVPVWPAGMARQKHVRAQFKTVCPLGEDSVLYVATSGVYQVFVDGRFVAYGPARAGRGHFRVDEIPLGRFAGPGGHAVVIEAAGYYVNSFYIMKQPSFLQAELCSGGTVVRYTGGDGFICRLHPGVIRRVQRFSFQRPMIEAYALAPEMEAFRRDNTLPAGTAVEVQPAQTLLPRQTPYPQYETLPAEPVSCGTVRHEPPAAYTDSRSYTGIGETLEGFLPQELELSVAREVQALPCTPAPERAPVLTLGADEYVICRLPHNAAGFPAFTVTCEEPLSLYVVFDEVLCGGDVDILRDECARAVKYTLQPGRYELQFFEVYVMQYLKLMAVGGCCRVEGLRLVEYKHPAVPYRLPEKLAADPTLRLLAEAAIETFRQNAVDLFTDCPGRERGGYPCDSFFTARAEYLLTGESWVEKAFLENFLHEETYAYLPEGMIPMCYPADHPDGVYIANWGLWLILELEEYVLRTGDREMAGRYEGKVQGLLRFHQALENADGLLEKVPEGVFVEWSRANELVQDVNYPSNMLYSAALRAAARLYGNEAWRQRAEQVRAAVLAQSYDGRFFTDHAVRRDGRLVSGGESTEICQYYAFYFDIASPQSHPELFALLRDRFGAARRENGEYPEIALTNMFIGIPLRMETLLKYGCREQALADILAYFVPMARQTGTFWESVGVSGSYSHGFTAHVLNWLTRIFEEEG